jgi:signal recognition particle receptor subunit beta
MVFFNHATRQMTAKIVYYGPGLCGKTTNLSTIYERTTQKARGEMVSLNTETDRTLFFDLLPMDVGIIGGFRTKLQLYTVPGQVFYNSTRKLVLKGVDGIVFVADSQTAMLDANKESLQNLVENLRELGLDLAAIPMVIQWNKRDLKQVVALDVLERELNPRHLESFPAVARDGSGVFETLRGISRLALTQIKRHELGEREPLPVTRPPAPPPAPPPPAPPPAPPPPAYAPAPPPPPSYAPPPPPPTYAPQPPAHAPQRPPQPSAYAPQSPSYPPLPAYPPPPAPAAPAPPMALLPWELSMEDGRVLEAPAPPAYPEPRPPASALPEPLSFLDLPASMDMFEPPSDLPERAEAPIRGMAPLVVRPLPPLPPASSAQFAAAAAAAVTLPRLDLKPLGVRALPPVHPGAGRGVAGLQIALPAELDGAELEVQVLVRHRGRVVAQAVAPLAGAGSLTLEFKQP